MRSSNSSCVCVFVFFSARARHRARLLSVGCSRRRLSAGFPWTLSVMYVDPVMAAAASTV